MNDALEAHIADLQSSGPPVRLPLDLLAPAPVFQSVRSGTSEAASAFNADPGTAVVKFMADEAYSEMWATMHDMAGGMIQMRTGHPCPLGDQARSAGGKIACDASLSLIKSNPALARLILSEESTFFGQIAAIGMHGFACVQMVKASATATIPIQEPVEDLAA